MTSYPTIKLSRELQHEILNKVNSLFVDRIKAHYAETECLGDIFYELMIPEHERKVLAAVPSRYFSPDSYVDVNVAGITRRLEFSTPKILPREYDLGVHGVDKNWREIIVRDTARFADIIAKFKESDANVKNTELERNNMKDRVGKVLAQYATLRQLLKDHPTFWELIPPDIQRRYSTPVERAKQEKQKLAPKEAVDLSDLATVVITNKIVGGL